MILFNYIQDIFRLTINDQIREFKKLLFENKTHVECAITKLSIPIVLCDIDHEPPLTFARLVYDFLRDNFPKGLITINPDDIALMDNWRKYHKEHCKLRATYSVANRCQEKIFPNWFDLLVTKPGDKIYLTETALDAIALSQCGF